MRIYTSLIIIYDNSSQDYNARFYANSKGKHSNYKLNAILGIKYNYGKE